MALIRCGSITSPYVNVLADSSGLWFVADGDACTINTNYNQPVTTSLGQVNRTSASALTITPNRDCTIKSAINTSGTVTWSSEAVSANTPKSFTISGMSVFYVE